MSTFQTLFGVTTQAAAGLQHREPRMIRTTASYVDHVKAAICLTPGCRSLAVRSNITKAKNTGSASTHTLQRKP